MIHWQVLCGDVRERLAELPAGSVQCCCTSPPYWGLRDYGTSKWEGGAADCDHAPRAQLRGTFEGGAPASLRDKPSQTCKCGAKRIDNQIGLEPTPDAYVAAMVRVFAAVRDVLADDGVLWLNLGDTYAQNFRWGDSDNSGAKQWTNRGSRPFQDSDYACAPHSLTTGLKQKDLCGIPWRVALALQADGWYLRSDIIWSKPNPMPESVTDRPTKAHEYIFLLTKSARYFYDADAIREPNTVGTIERLASGPVQAKALGPKNQLGRRDGNVRPYTGQATKDYDAAGAQNPSDTKRRILGAMADPEYLGRNKRSVWHVATQPYPDAHFATYPEALIEPCILAGSKPGDTILDPFCGSGTTGAVAVRHQRNFLGIELNPAYVELSRKRIGAVAPLFASERTA